MREYNTAVTMKRIRQRFSRFLIVHGRRVWVSEFFSLLFIAFVALVLLSETGILLYKSFRVASINDRLLALQLEKIPLRHRLEKFRSAHRVFREKQNISGAIDRLTHGRIDSLTRKRLIDLVYKNSQRFGYDPLLVMAVIKVESSFDPHALGRYKSGELSGAMGLMQLKLPAAKEAARKIGMQFHGYRDLFKPERNIILGITYLTMMISRFRSLKLGILAYNQGPGTISHAIRNDHNLSISYYRKVIDSYYHLKNAIQSDPAHKESFLSLQSSLNKR